MHEYKVNIPNVGDLNAEFHVRNFYFEKGILKKSGVKKDKKGRFKKKFGKIPTIFREKPQIIQSKF